MSQREPPAPSPVYPSLELAEGWWDKKLSGYNPAIRGTATRNLYSITLFAKLYWVSLPTWPRRGPDNLPWTSAGGYWAGGIC